ncbi:T9SS type A sorting domain-containing protein [Puia dinghuensis]|uniref:Secretion system C-terminal sorting domain-containing protein n=1 Tax=Puia dinghuensis TaxID=1792502 RepID=A0A8J2UFM2_9BACT|nr:T9SS type A sorting domain-containing protein [Puia dinghuensis]GGB11122.1 hypothetical protein GCM10011511_38370 [Puia dinghuensis]
MKPLICLTLLAIAFSRASQAQEAPATPDSTGAHVHQASERPVMNFTAVVKEPTRVVWLQWDADSAKEGDYFIVERSQGDHDHNHQFETIGALRSTGTRGHYELTDQAPPNGSDFYRIKYAGSTGPAVYSKTMELSLSGDVDFKFYPNPVDKLFIVRTEHSIDLQILDQAGNIRASKRLQPGIQVIDVSTLEHGVYVLRVTDKESNRAVSQQLVKN